MLARRGPKAKGIAAFRADHCVTPEITISEALISLLREGVIQLIEENPRARPEHLVSAYVAAAGETPSG